VVLYGYEILSLTLREGYKLEVSENGALRRTIVLKKDEMTGVLRNLHCGELHNCSFCQVQVE
jgi:hypothetical protein